jgi:hypothetical protein
MLWRELDVDWLLPVSVREKRMTFAARPKRRVLPQGQLDGLETRSVVALADEVAIFRASLDENGVGAFIHVSHTR